MNALFFLAFLALMVTTGARIGFRQARVTYVRTNARIDADVAFLRAIPTDMEWAVAE